MPGPTLQPITETPNVDAVERMRLEMGTTPEQLIAERVQDARTELVEATKVADRHNKRDAHVRLGSAVIGLDDLQAELASGGRS